MTEQWNGFNSGKWQTSVDVADFIAHNVTPYVSGADFLAPPTNDTIIMRDITDELLKAEREKGGVLSIDTDRVSSVLSYPAARMHATAEKIKGLQTDEPLKRGVNPFGGIRMARQACDAYGYRLGDNVEKAFEYKTTHNDGVFRVYTPAMRKLRKAGVLTGLPDAYGRGRIIGDYRRVALYGIDLLVESKQKDFDKLAERDMTDEIIRLREEVARQIDFLQKLAKMAAEYGDDITKPAANALQAAQWTYYAYLGAVKEQNGAAMSLGRVSTFLDIYIERDFTRGLLDESSAQEIIDQFVLKARIVRQLRTPEYNELFAGDPTWVTESIGGMAANGKTLVTKNSFRMLHTLENLGSAPEPNLTVLWSNALPQPFKEYCAELSLKTSSIQYENDDIMRGDYGDDYGIACCVSAMKLGKQMQFFGARCNLAKLLLISINGGRDEITGDLIAPQSEPMTGVLDYDRVVERYKTYIDWLAHEYVNTMNIIHNMHDKYAYEKLQMALHDTEPERLMAFGAAGISVVGDSLSAIKYAKVKAIANASGIVDQFETKGEFPCYGNDDDRVDFIVRDVAEYFITSLKRTPTYRKAKHTLSLLTITSNVVYGKKTGATPDGRAKGAPFAPGANPMHGREVRGALASLNSVAKIRYCDCLDGISDTFDIVPTTIGKTVQDQKVNLVSILDGYFAKGAHHLNVNAYDRETLVRADRNPELYPNLTIRVSGYAVRFCLLSAAHRKEVLARTFFDNL